MEIVCNPPSYDTYYHKTPRTGSTVTSRRVPCGLKNQVGWFVSEVLIVTTWCDNPDDHNLNLLELVIAYHTDQISYL